jgi:NlpC/P60 family
MIKIKKLPQFFLTYSLLACFLNCGRIKESESDTSFLLSNYALEKKQERTGSLGQKLPAETLVKDSNGSPVALFSMGSRTAVFYGKNRVLSEKNFSVEVKTNTWVRILPMAYNGSIPEEWFNAAMRMNQELAPDVLGIGLQYVEGQPEIKNNQGQVIAADASYGPFDDTGTNRVGGSDVMDFLGTQIVGVLSNGRSKPKNENLRSLDCSGFIRIVFGYRHSVKVGEEEIIVPLAKSNPAEADALPRTAAEILQANIGINIAPDKVNQIKVFDDLRVGDLVFFRAEIESERDIDHVGIYLGIDSSGEHRFLSSRKTANGPTMGDVGGASVLNGNGVYAKSFHAVKRL